RRAEGRARASPAQSGLRGGPEGGRSPPSEHYDRTWQATQWSRETSFKTCSFSEQDGTRMEQRVWKRQPEGGLIGLGTSPSRMIRLRLTAGSGMGTAESSASV